MKPTTRHRMILWTARSIALIEVAFCLFMLIGYLLEGRDKGGPGPEGFVILTFLVWGMGLAALLWACWKPGTGGLASLLCFTALNILAAVNPNPEARYSPVLLFFLLPSLLFLWGWWGKRKVG